MTTRWIQNIKTLLPIGEKTQSSDFAILTNAMSIDEIDVLGFFDSRAKKTDPDDGEFFARLLANEFESRGRKYLIITRSHASTTFFTLCNFLTKVNHRFPEVWTNVGFVDLTPKKRGVIDDILLQARTAFPRHELEVRHLEDFILNSGEVAPLYTVDLEPMVELIAETLASFVSNLVMLETHEIPSRVKFPRERPQSFYTQLIVTNVFLRKLGERLRQKMVESTILETVLHQDYTTTLFDGVHFTQPGHQVIFEHILDQLKKNRRL